MIILAAMMIGASSGVLIADRDALVLLKKDLAAQLAAVRSRLRPTRASAKPETPEVIPTGLSSIVAIQYFSRPESAQMAFDLQATDLVRTGKLRDPDRIYFDLQDRSREPGASKRLQKQKTISIAGNLLSGVRISQRKQGIIRIVLDLKCPCDFTYQTSPAPSSRLTVEIQPRPARASASNTQSSSS
jgi:hypothetical protein